MPEMLQKFSVFPDLMEPSSIFVLGGQNPSKQQITKGDLVTVENHYFWIFLGRLLEVHFIWPTGDSIYIQYLTLCWHRWHRSRQCRHGHLWQQAGQLWRWNERCSLVPEAQGFAGVEEGPGYGGLTGSLQLRVVWPIIIHHPLQSLWLRKDIGHIKHAETVSGAARVWKHWCRQQQWHTETTTYNPYSVVHSTTQQVKGYKVEQKPNTCDSCFCLKYQPQYATIAVSNLTFLAGPFASNYWAQHSFTFQIRAYCHNCWTAFWRSNSGEWKGKFIPLTKNS